MVRLRSYDVGETTKVVKFVPITLPKSKDWTIAQANRAWRINAAAVKYLAETPNMPDYRTQEGQDYFSAICWWFMSRPLPDENRPSAQERKQRADALDTFVARLRS